MHRVLQSKTNVNHRLKDISLGFLWLLFFLIGVKSQAQAPIAQFLTEQQMLQSGKELFNRHCMGCHAIDAKGTGLSAPMLNPKPRNLVEGSFKLRSTPSGTLPTKEDLLRTISQGIPNSSMPNFRQLSQSQQMALVIYIMSLRSDWKENQGAPIPLPNPPTETFSNKDIFLASAQRGHELYKEACLTCHGVNADGNGPDAEGLVDNDNNPIKPANFQARILKSGIGAGDIFKAISTGLDGSPMPGFFEIYSESQIWDLTAFVLFKRGQGVGLYAKDYPLENHSAKQIQSSK